MGVLKGKKFGKEKEIWTLGMHVQKRKYHMKTQQETSHLQTKMGGLRKNQT